MGYLRIMVVVRALAVVVGGCGSGSARTAAADAQVESGSCQVSGAGGRAYDLAVVFFCAQRWSAVPLPPSV